MDIYKLGSAAIPVLLDANKALAAERDAALASLSSTTRRLAEMTRAAISLCDELCEDGNHTDDAREDSCSICAAIVVVRRAAAALDSPKGEMGT